LEDRSEPIPPQRSRVPAVDFCPVFGFTCAITSVWFILSFICYVLLCLLPELRILELDPAYYFFYSLWTNPTSTWVYIVMEFAFVDMQVRMLSSLSLGTVFLARYKPPSQKHRSQTQRRQHSYLYVHKRKLHDVPCLGDLRRAFTTKNRAPAKSSDSSQFDVIAFDHLDPTRHHLLYGTDAGILGYYVPPEYLASGLPTDFLSTLDALVQGLPSIGKSD
jgi:hypothetical protein